jgi:hypothetical protein
MYQHIPDLAVNYQIYYLLYIIDYLHLILLLHMSYIN